MVRETWEEVGLDLNAEDFIPVGRLDDREITSAQDGKLIMMLSPFGKDNGMEKPSYLIRRLVGGAVSL